MNKLIYKILFSGVLFTNTYGGGSESEEGSAEVSYSTEPNDAALSSQPQLEDLILEEICALCERPGFEERDPFCLAYNLRNIREIITPVVKHMQNRYFNETRATKTKERLCDEICYYINRYLINILNISHFELTLEPNPIKQEKKPCQYSIENKYVKIKITDFEENFDIEQFKYGLYEATNNQKGIIVDLRDNPGGLLINLKYLLSYFFNDNAVIIHCINRQHEQFFGEMFSWKKQPSKQELKELIGKIQINWNLEKRIWSASHYENGSPIIQKNIAILINEKSASCSEYFTLAVNGNYPNRVKIIGEKSAGNLLISLSSISLSSFPGLSLTYPREEIIGVDGTRVEGVGIEPDIVSNDEEEIMKAAIEWVTQEPKP